MPYENLGNSLQRQNESGKFRYRFALGDGGFYYPVDPDDVILKEDLIFKPLLSPTITPAWTFNKLDGSPYYIPSSTDKHPIVDLGVRANLVGSFKYPVPGPDDGIPQAVSGDFGTILPPPNTESSPFGWSDIIENTDYSVVLSKPSTGLVVVNNHVEIASGNDTTSDNVSVEFRTRSYLGFSSNSILTDSQILALANPLLVNGKNRTVGPVSAGSGLYTYYVYLASFGALTNIVMDGAEPILGAFTRLSNVSIINEGGATIVMAVYKSNATQAFTSNTLTFS